MKLLQLKKKKTKPNWLTLKLFILNMKQHYFKKILLTQIDINFIYIYIYEVN
jgi:hypothetical protein